MHLMLHACMHVSFHQLYALTLFCVFAYERSSNICIWHLFAHLHASVCRLYAFDTFLYMYIWTHQLYAFDTFHICIQTFISFMQLMLFCMYTCKHLSIICIWHLFACLHASFCRLYCRYFSVYIHMNFQQIYAYCIHVCERLSNICIETFMHIYASIHEIYENALFCIFACTLSSNIHMHICIYMCICQLYASGTFLHVTLSYMFVSVCQICALDTFLHICIHQLYASDTFLLV